MAAVKAKRKRILFVDDEPAFLETIGTIIEQTAGDEWRPYFAESAGKALSLLQEQPMDLVVIDVHMPVIDGVQFLNLVHRKHPQLPKVVLTGFATEEHRVACLSGGAELFLEKPRGVDGLHAILATLHELARWQPEQGFRGVLRRVGLPDIIQMECLSRHSVVLFVSGDEGSGEIFIRDGEIIHAETGSLDGEAAFNAILVMQGGEFDLRAYRDPPRQSMEGQWEFLLMEAARLQDERAEAAGPPADGAAPDPQRDVPAALHEFSGNSSVSLDDLPDLFAQPTAAPAGEPEPDTDTAFGPTPEAGTRPAPPSATPRRNRIDEVLLCSRQGDVLYEFQCRDTNGRLNFLEFVSQRARQVGRTLELGEFDRLEVLTTEFKVVARIRPDHGLLVRFSQTDPPVVAAFPEPEGA